MPGAWYVKQLSNRSLMFRPPLTGHGGRNRAECNNGTMRPELPLGGVAAPQRPPVISGSPSIDGTVVFASGSITELVAGYGVSRATSTVCAATGTTARRWPE